MKKYNKLVRDNIPKIIIANGSTPKTRSLDDKEYLTALCNKLVEEAMEARDNPVIEELADLLEVIMAIAKNIGYSFQQIEKVREKKKKLRGGFDKRIFLEETNE